MDRQVIEQKPETLRLCIARVGERVPATVAELVGDADAQDVITLNLARAVQSCVDIGATAKTHRETPLWEPSLYAPEGARGDRQVGIAARAPLPQNPLAGIPVGGPPPDRFPSRSATRHIGDFTSFAAAVVDFVKNHDDNAGRPI